MWNIERIVLQNLLSFKELDYTFIQNKCTMVYGLNNSDNGSDSNGAGKSSIIEGITLLLTGETCRDVDKEDYINDYADMFEGQLYLSNKITKESLIINREIFRGSKASKVKIHENGKENKQITSVAEANKRIFELVAVSKEDLLNFFIIGQGNNSSFFTSNDNNKKEIISRLTNSELLNPVVDEINRLTLEVDEKKQEIDDRFITCDAKIEVLQEQISEEKENTSNQISDIIKLSEEQIKSNEEQIKENKKQINLELISVKKLSDKIKDIEKTSEQLAVKELEFEKLDKRKKAEQKVVEETKHLYFELKAMFAGEVVCPKCKNKFLSNSEMSVSELNQAIKDTDKILADKLLIVNKTTNEVRLLCNEIDRLEKIVAELQSLIYQSRTKKTIIDNFLKANLRAENDINKINERIAKIKAESKKGTKLTELKGKLLNQQNLLENITAELDKVLKEQEKIIFWKHHLSKKGFLTFLANKAIKSIEGSTNYYLKKFDTNLTVTINGYTPLKSGEVREKIDVFVQKNGIQKGRFGRYSGGEKNRVNIACILGLQKLINLSAKDRGLNFLFLDENFEGVDGSGQEQILSILQSVGTTTLIISHENNSIGAENELFIIKENNESKIVE